MYFNILGCGDITCSNQKHEVCQQYDTNKNAQCVCKPGFKLNINGKCKTQPIVFKLRIRFTIPFLNYLFDLFDQLTIRFATEMEGRLKIALRLTRRAIVVIISFRPGSTLTEFMVLMPSNTTENESTIRTKLIDEIYNNATESLYTYFPTPPGDINSTLLEVNGKCS